MAPSVLRVTLAPRPPPPARRGEGAPVCRPGGARTRLAPEPRPVFAPGSARLSSEPSLRPKRQPHLRHGRESPPRGPRGSVSSGAGREARPRGVDGRPPGGPRARCRPRASGACRSPPQAADPLAFPVSTLHGFSAEPRGSSDPGVFMRRVPALPLRGWFPLAPGPSRLGRSFPRV